jgi:integrative and conjugative element protein (TIGR02256 family)
MLRKHRPELLSRLMIYSSVLDFIEKESARASRTETGGVLAGHGDLMKGEAQVTHASKPGPKARRTMFSFSRDTKYCQKFLDEIAANSDGRIDYVGEWHKHHEESPTPSSRDIITSTNIAKSSDYHVNQCLLLIIGRSNCRSSLRAFAVDRNGVVAEVLWAVCTDDGPLSASRLFPGVIG